MVNSIYLVDPTTQQPVTVNPASFAEINVRERENLEAWVISNPEILGESLLVITSEFSRFDRSSKRLDILAIDKDGVLVVVELKLDVAGSLADQQAIRYAVFCSNMTIERSEPLTDIAPRAAELMKTLIDRTWPVLETL